MTKPVFRTLTFVIPIRHPETLRDPVAQQRTLHNTFTSIAGQTDDNWRAVVVANDGAELPTLPRNFEVAPVSYGPNPQHELSEHNFTEAMDFFRLDKGRRVWSGMRQYPETEYFMIVDDDDFVSRQLTSFIKAHNDQNGWFIERGYAVDPDGPFAIDISRFHKTCGTSHIARADLYDLPEDDTSEDFAPYVRKWLGSHGATTEHFEALGAPLSVLPFHGAVYLLNNPNSHSVSNTLIRQYIVNKGALSNPAQLIDALRRLKRINGDFNDEFFGEGRI